MKLNYSIKVYDHSVSEWVEVAKLGFYPDIELAEQIAEKHAENYIMPYSKLRILCDCVCLKEIEY